MKYPNVDRANEYARAVVAGDIPACKWIRLACQRHLDDLRAAKLDGARYYFDHRAGEVACLFIQALPHTKGKWASKGERLRLEPWQCFFIACIFGWMRSHDHLRRYRRALLWVPRKNGKSALAAGIGLYMLAADREYGAEVYSGATTEKQAWEVFRPAKLMAQKTPELLEHFGIEVNASNIHIMDNASRFEPVIGKPGDGSSPHCAIVDEYHEHADDTMVDTMETGMGAREQPLLLMITTAGDNMAGPCYQMQVDAQKMLEGVIDDDQTLALIYTVDAGDDWTKPETIRKANPNFGVSVSEDFLLSRLNDAKNNARKQSTFQTKHLNIWVGARNAYFNVERWRQCTDPSITLESMAGKPCYLGLDLASKVDIAALEILFPLGDGDYVRFGRYYLPETAVENGVNEHYQGWMRDGVLTITDGEIIDFNRIKDDILDLCSRFEVVECAYDPFQATMLVTELMTEGVPVVEMRPTVLNFSEPMKTLDGLIRARRIRHDGDPVMTWMVSNVVAKEDAKENVFPRKDRPENKIDGVVALLMALGRAMTGSDQDISSAIFDVVSVKL
jgi:phage terminase large subunit-like protein